MNPNGESSVSGDLISKKPNGKDGVSSDEPIKCTGQSGVSSAKAVSGDPLSKKPNGKAVVSSAEPIKHSSGTDGGDLIKWDKTRIGFHVGIDIAEGSIEDCRTRYNGDADQHQRRKKFSKRMPLLLYAVASLLCNTHGLLRHMHDGLWKCLSSSLSEQCLMPMLSLKNSDKLNVWRLLIVYTGFVLVNGFLKRNSNLAAPLVSNTSFTLRHLNFLEMLLIALNGLSFNIFKSLAEEYDLELVFVKNSHEVVHELGALGDGNQDQSKSLSDEWDAAYLYLSFVLRKRGGESDGGQRRGGRRKNGKMNLSKDDVLYIDNESVKECNFTQRRVS
ncbi:unnamed protein product [Brassica oleracea var. botrytis]